MMEVDRTLHYTSIVPSLEEWNATFQSFDKFGPVHVWLRCVGNQVRGYAFHEALLSLNYHLAAEHTGKIVNMRINNVPVAFMQNKAGFEFYWDVPSALHNTTIVLTVNGWLHSSILHLTHCEAPVAPNKEIDLVMSVYTWDEVHYGASRNIPLLQGVVNSIARHANYHICTLNITYYEIEIHEDQLAYYLSNSYIDEQHTKKRIRFVFKINHPAPLNIKSAAYQAIYENLAILRHWTKPTRLLFWDPDEYLYYDSTQLQTIQQMLTENTIDVLSFYRVGVVRSTMDADQSDPANVFTNSTYYIVDRELAPKIAINPNAAGCVYVHAAHCLRSKFVHVDPHVVYLLHFENAVYKRVVADNTTNMKQIDLSRLDVCNRYTNNNTTVLNHALLRSVRNGKNVVPYRVADHYTSHLDQSFSAYFVLIIVCMVFVCGLMVGKFVRSRTAEN